MTFNINDFRKLGLTGGGARPSLFEVVISPGLPEIADTTTLTKFSFTCSASEIPAATIGSIDVGYFGRQIKLAGDRTYPDWNVTILNDEDFSVRNMFEAWSNQINQFVGNVKLSKGNSYKNGSAIVTQYGTSGQKLRSYEFVGIFPTNVANIGLDWDQQNRIETFDVTFSYDYWVPQVVGGTIPIDTGMPGGTRAPQE